MGNLLIEEPETNQKNRISDYINEFSGDVRKRTYVEYVFGRKESNPEIQAPITIRDYFSFFNKIANSSDPENYKSKLGCVLPDFVDLSGWCSKVRKQEFNSCAAHAAVALVEYMHLYEAIQETVNTQEEDKNAPPEPFLYKDLSELFLYKAAIQLSEKEENEETGSKIKKNPDPGTSISKVMEAIVKYGIPPEEVWPETNGLEQDLAQDCYWHGYRYRDIKYFRLDYKDISVENLLAQIKILLANRLPCMFAAIAFTELANVRENGEIHLPAEDKTGQKEDEAHALVAVGYDDHKQIGATTGALLVRNSWGEDWGIKGYGWLPYAYVEQELVMDCWALLSLSWTKDIDFGIGINVGPDVGKPGWSQSATSG